MALLILLLPVDSNALRPGRGRDGDIWTRDTTIGVAFGGEGLLSSGESDSSSLCWFRDDTRFFRGIGAGTES